MQPTHDSRGSAGTRLAIVVMNESRYVGIVVLVTAADDNAALSIAERPLNSYGQSPNRVGCRG